MASVQEDGTDRIESPDPSSHAVNIYDTVDTESEWVDEDGDDDDMDFEPTTDDSEENEFFDSNEEGVEAEFYGILYSHRANIPTILHTIY